MLIMIIRPEEELINKLEELKPLITDISYNEVAQYLAHDDLPAAQYLLEVLENKFAEDLI
jgi:hypothetical protein